MANLFQNNPFTGNMFQNSMFQNPFGSSNFVGQNYNWAGTTPAWNYQGANFFNEFVDNNVGKAALTGFMSQGAQGSGKAPIFGFTELAPTSGPGSNPNLDYATYAEAEAPVAYGMETDNYMADLARMEPNPRMRYAANFGLSDLAGVAEDRAASNKASQLRRDITTYCSIKNKDKALQALNELLATAQSIGDESAHADAMRQVESATAAIQEAFPGPGITDDIQAALPGLALAGGQLASMLGLFGKKPAAGPQINITKSSNTGLYVGLGVGALALIGLGIVLMRRAPAPPAAPPLGGQLRS